MPGVVACGVPDDHVFFTTRVRSVCGRVSRVCAYYVLSPHSEMRASQCSIYPSINSRYYTSYNIMSKAFGGSPTYMICQTGRPGGAYEVILEPGTIIGQFREFEPRRVQSRINSLGLFLVHALTCGKRESVS